MELSMRKMYNLEMTEEEVHAIESIIRDWHETHTDTAGITASRKRAVAVAFYGAVENL